MITTYNAGHAEFSGKLTKDLPLVITNTANASGKSLIFKHIGGYNEQHRKKR